MNEDQHAIRQNKALAKRSRSVLVVDDDPLICWIITYALEEAGYHVICATDGGSALAVAASERLDLLLLDIMMPGIDGWAVLSQLRSDAGPQPPIVIMTAAYDEQDRSLASGAQGYLAKPFSLDDLLECVDLHAGLHVANGQEMASAHALLVQEVTMKPLR